MRYATAITTLCAVLAVPTQAWSARPLALELLSDGSIIVPVWIDGRGPFRFVLDTGSSRTVIARDLSATLRRPVIAKTTVVTAARHETGYIVELPRVRLGDLPAVDVRALLNLQNQFANRPDVHGVIGQDVLARRTFTIDYQRRTIEWTRGTEPSGGTTLPLTIEDGRAVVTLQGIAGEPALKLVPDTGTSHLVLFKDACACEFTAAPVEMVRINTITGAAIAHRVVLDAFRIGSIVVRNVDLVIVKGGGAGLMQDGLLPLHWFARVTFDGPAGALVLYP